MSAEDRVKYWQRRCRDAERVQKYIEDEMESNRHPMTAVWPLPDLLDHLRGLHDIGANEAADQLAANVNRIAALEMQLSLSAKVIGKLNEERTETLAAMKVMAEELLHPKELVVDDEGVLRAVPR